MYKINKNFNKKKVFKFCKNNIAFKILKNQQIFKLKEIIQSQIFLHPSINNLIFN